MEFDKSPNLKYQDVTVNSAKEKCGNPQKFYIELTKVSQVKIHKRDLT